MKRFIILSVLLLAVIGVAGRLWGDQVLSNTLDARLASLLTERLGLPVTLAPIDARAIRLRALSAKLVMGDPADPAVVATNVEVRLYWPDLLKGEVRLVFASADDLMVKPSRWPSSGNPAPDNYHFLDPWLPRKLAFNTGRYVTEDATGYAVQDAAWSRLLEGGMRLSWAQQRKGGLVEQEAALKSLEDLLALTDVQLTLQGKIDGADDSAFTVALDIQPDDSHAYVLNATVDAIDTTLTTQATGSQRWQWPDASRSHYGNLDLGELGKFLALFSDPDAEDTAESFLASALPALDLIPHTGSLELDKIQLAGEIVRNTSLDFETSGAGLHIDPLRLDGPRARLTGAIDIVSSAKGWDFKLDANLLAREGGSISDVFEDTEWIWEGGNTQLAGSGSTWGELVYALDGHVNATGHHRGEVKTPVSVEAVLDSEPGKLEFDHLEIALGEGRFQGSAVLSGTKHRKLTLDLTGEKLHVDFLFDADEEGIGGPGIAVPEYLDVLPSLDLDWTLNVTDLNAPGLTLASARGRLERFETWGKLVLKAEGMTGGTLNLDLDADFPEDNIDHYKLQTRFNRLDLPAMFEQPTVLHSRSSGTLQFAGGAREMLELFEDMQGTAKLAVEIRPDNDWQRPARDNEKLELEGAGKFVIEGKNIVGITLKNLDIESTEQDMTGSLSMVATRSPWLIANLESDKLDVYGLMALFPDSSEEADQQDFLQTMRNLGAARLSLKVDSLTVGEAPVSRLHLKLESDKDLFKIEEIGFYANGDQLEGSGEITWQGKLAKIELATTLTDVDLDQFIILDPNLEHVSIDGTAQLNSEGETVADLIANFTGDINLASEERDPASGEPKRQLLMKARRLENGVQADVEKLRLSKNNLSGTVRYTRTTPPQLDIDIHNGKFSLLPWESAPVEGEKKADKEKTDGGEPDSGIRDAASTSANAVGRLLSAPLRMLEASEDRDKERMFSDETLPFDALKKINLSLSGKLDTLESSVASLHQLSLDGKLTNGVLDITATAGQLNEGQATVELSIDAGTQPPKLALKADFNDVRGLTSNNTYTRSGFASVTAQGQSTAALAASLNGLVYLDLGPGPFDYRNARLISSSIANQVFNTLIPGSTQKTPQLECGITVAEFTDGKAETPYGYAIRTTQANLLGHFKLDLANEQMVLNFESRSREGVGLSVGNVISNSVQVRGSFTDPRIVPRATSIAWRGWAAFMTVGLSVVAESVIKRAMASENPCPPIKKLIRDEMCPTSAIAASSKRMCPPGQTAQAN